MNKVLISGLTVPALIGVHAYEQQTTQMLTIHLSVSVDIARAATEDCLTDTLDYKVLSDAVVLFVSKTPCRLLETLAHRLMLHLKKMFQLDWLELSITKHPKDMPNVEGISVVVTSAPHPR